MATDLTELTETIEGIRAEKYPAVPSDLVTAILAAEAETQEKSQRKTGLARTRSAVNAVLTQGN